jgi:hypothetical protein
MTFIKQLLVDILDVPHENHNNQENRVISFYGKINSEKERRVQLSERRNHGFRAYSLKVQ